MSITAVLLVLAEHLKEYPGYQIITFTCPFHNLPCKKIIVFKFAQSIPQQPSNLASVLYFNSVTIAQ